MHTMEYNRHMSQTATTIKIDSKIKSDAQELAATLGLSLSVIIENKLREVLRERRVVFEEEPQPNKAFIASMKKIDHDIATGKNISGSFTSVDDLITSLNTDED